MIKHHMGTTGLETTALGFGAMELAQVEYKDAERLLNKALDEGIQFIDSSPCYGRAEEYVGRAIGGRRQEYVLATKCACNVDEHGKFASAQDHIWTAEQLYRNIDRSLALLKTDHIDIWQLHGLMPEYLSGGQNDEALAAAEKIKASGKVGHIAFSCRNGAPSQPDFPAMFGYKACRAMMPWKRFEVIQLIYGALTRTNENIIEEAGAQGVGIICRGAVKKYFAHYDELFTKAKLDELLEQGESRTAFLIRFAMAKRGIDTVIVGTKNPSHLQENIRAAEAGPLPAEVWREAASRLSNAGVAPV